jgi:DNA-binding SARP family transcriptional activator/FixJ family two-component response regulator
MPPRVLVVDADERTYRLFADILGRNYRLLFLTGAETAMDIAQAQPVSTIFIGQTSAEDHGLALLQQLKLQHPSTPVIFIANAPSAEVILAAFRAGAREVITAPIDPEELSVITEKIVGLAELKSSGAQWLRRGRTGLASLMEKIRPADRFSAGALFSSASGRIHFGKTSLDPTPVAAGRGSADRLRPGVPGESRPELFVFLLGRFRVMVGSRIMDDWPSRKGKSIFAYLAYHGDKRIYRDVLMDVFWPKSTPESARNCLNVAIHGLRRKLHSLDPEHEYILFRDQCYYLNPEAEPWTDVGDFREMWRHAQAIDKSAGLSAAAIYAQAASLYADDFMRDELYEDWSTLERENLKELYLICLEKVSEQHFQAGNFDEAIGCCETILEKDSCREEIYRRVMFCYQKTARRDKALRTYRRCVQSLKADLDVEPTAATIELYKRIKAGRRET